MSCFCQGQDIFSNDQMLWSVCDNRRLQYMYMLMPSEAINARSSSTSRTIDNARCTKINMKKNV